MGDNKKAVRRSGRPASTLTAREPFVNRVVPVLACNVPMQMAENIRCTDPGSACIELIDRRSRLLPQLSAFAQLPAC
jgi:hypothetical protein